MLPDLSLAPEPPIFLPVKAGPYLPFRGVLATPGGSVYLAVRTGSRIIDSTVYAVYQIAVLERPGAAQSLELPQVFDVDVGLPVPPHAARHAIDGATGNVWIWRQDLGSVEGIAPDGRSLAIVPLEGGVGYTGLLAVDAARRTIWVQTYGEQDPQWDTAGRIYRIDGIDLTGVSTPVAVTMLPGSLASWWGTDMDVVPGGQVCIGGDIDLLADASDAVVLQPAAIGSGGSAALAYGEDMAASRDGGCWTNYPESSSYATYVPAVGWDIQGSPFEVFVPSPGLLETDPTRSDAIHFSGSEFTALSPDVSAPVPVLVTWPAGLLAPGVSSVSGNLALTGFTVDPFYGHRFAVFGTSSATSDPAAALVRFDRAGREVSRDAGGWRRTTLEAAH